MKEKEKISLTFLGGAATVTGSKILLRTPRHQVLIDCGLFQGLKALREKNWQPLPLQVRKLEGVLLTHGHLDHCGSLPQLVRSGYTGPIHCTPPTLDIAGIILKDSARLQEEDAERANRYSYSKHHPAKPLYTVQDVEETLPLFQVHEDREWVVLNEEMKFRFLKSGHILGSAMIEMNCLGRKIVFTGDLGRPRPFLLHSPETVKEADYLVLESTYGDRVHPEVSAYAQLQEIITRTVRRGGTVVIPSFAVQRAQELLLIINTLKQEQQIPPVPVYLDSPMGVDVTRLFAQYPQWHTMSRLEIHALNHGVHLISRFEDTLRVLDKKISKIIIAGSGMITGGRILYYLENLLGDKRNTILLAGFQAAGTRGALLKNGATDLKFHGKYYPVRAEVQQMESLSAHADAGELMQWLGHLKNTPKQVFLNHGEPQASDALRTRVSTEFGWNCTIAGLEETYYLD